MASSVRYGVKLRKREEKALKQKNARHACPKCGKKSLTQGGTGIWNCNSCKAKIAGGAYAPKTS
ncbi:MAG: hypothetical protein AABW54_03715 [Candidatus Micrarchaeota archaeon]